MTIYSFYFNLTIRNITSAFMITIVLKITIIYTELIRTALLVKEIMKNVFVAIVNFLPYLNL